ncbi:MAG: hypothetical protein BWY89_01785 [Bacteroidetes bacterium ADurb.BinA012]|nr:MAG: hypothetical protein BWY89_01785 [Bacteroidetes bacterium ADurb.BinA012]
MAPTGSPFSLAKESLRWIPLAPTGWHERVLTLLEANTGAVFSGPNG